VASFTRKKLHDMPRHAMLQLLFATFLFVFSLAELRVWNRSTFIGQQGTLAAGFGAWRSLNQAAEFKHLIEGGLFLVKRGSLYAQLLRLHSISKHA